LKSNEDLNAAWELCNHIYRGNPDLNKVIFAQIPTLTEEALTEIFKKHCSE
jgi:hypothetical protein